MSNSVGNTPLNQNALDLMRQTLGLDGQEGPSIDAPNGEILSTATINDADEICKSLGITTNSADEKAMFVNFYNTCAQLPQPILQSTQAFFQEVASAKGANFLQNVASASATPLGQTSGANSSSEAKTSGASKTLNPWLATSASLQLFTMGLEVTSLLAQMAKAFKDIEVQFSKIKLAMAHESKELEIKAGEKEAEKLQNEASKSYASAAASFASAGSSIIGMGMTAYKSSGTNEKARAEAATRQTSDQKTHAKNALGTTPPPDKQAAFDKLNNTYTPRPDKPGALDPKNIQKAQKMQDYENKYNKGKSIDTTNGAPKQMSKSEFKEYQKFQKDDGVKNAKQNLQERADAEDALGLNPQNQPVGATDAEKLNAKNYQSAKQDEINRFAENRNTIARQFGNMVSQTGSGIAQGTSQIISAHYDKENADRTREAALVRGTQKLIDSVLQNLGDIMRRLQDEYASDGQKMKEVFDLMKAGLPNPQSRA